MSEDCVPANDFPDNQLDPPAVPEPKPYRPAKAVLLALIALMAGGVWYTSQQQSDRDAAERQRDKGRSQHYAAQLNAALQAWREGQTDRTLNLLREQLPKAGEEDLRGFEWPYLWRLCQGDQCTFQG